MTIIERFLNYTRFDTQSAEDSQTVPSTSKQLVFASYLKAELESEGLSDVEMDERGYVYATLPSNGAADDVPVIGFIAHYDTSPDCSGKDVRARVVRNYDGGDIVLSEGATDESADGQSSCRRMVMSPKMFPELLDHVGEDLIVTDGHTLLGADDKAGIAEIVQAMVYLKEHPEVKHGTIRIAFNPDEEIGMGAHYFDVERFGCDWAYTMDGGEVGELEYENFNASAAKVEIKGMSVHPGYAKGKMVNASLLALEFNGLLPSTERPENTSGYEGFYHLTGMKGCCEHAQLSYIIRDHDRQRFESRKQMMHAWADVMNGRYGEGTVTVELHDQYYNMKEVVDAHHPAVETALQSMLQCGIEPHVKPIRGGTDGAQLSFRGLPCPNLFAGGLNFHGPYEFLPIPSMEKATMLIVKICELTTHHKT